MVTFMHMFTLYIRKGVVLLTPQTEAYVGVPATVSSSSVLSFKSQSYDTVKAVALASR